MAKSLRSKSKRAFRRIKREDPKSDYAVRDKIRVARLSEKLKAIKDVSDSEQEEDTANDGDMEVVADSTQGAKAELKAEEKGDSNHAPANAKAWTKLVWLLGILNQDSLTLANDGSSNSLRVLHDLSLEAGC